MNVRTKPWALAAALMLVAGCGGSDEAADDGALEEDTSGDEEAQEVNDGSSITGLMGTIRRDQVENTMNPRMDRLARCFSARMGAVEWLGGDIRLGFRVHTDGTVAWVYPIETNIGDRETEQCILDVAGRAHFPRPRGGEAEFTWGFGLDPADDIRPPLNWGEESLGDRADDVAEVARDCGVHGDYAITAYVEPGGAVLAAGGSAPAAEQLETLDCVLEAVRAWEMPDPGSYAAKITFTVR
jgi:hypothetical protein